MKVLRISEFFKFLDGFLDGKKVRPWGEFWNLDADRIKILQISSEQAIGYQYHGNRQVMWLILGLSFNVF